ncbi:MAG: hypothetical protein ACTSYD_11285 [Candidatus Heimdallarchaeaceae archaeon]
MELKQLQKELVKFLENKKWLNFPPSEIFIHLIEELGEIGRHILFETGYKTSEMGHSPPKKEDLKREFGQAFSLFLHLASRLNVDLEEAIINELENMKQRFQ